MASFSIKTPTRSINLSAKKKEQVLFFAEVEDNISKVCLGRISKSIEKSYEEQVAIIATFFQRVIARTPVDEKYERVINTKNGPKTIAHKPDREICREHWFIEESGSSTRIYSKSFFTKGKLGFDIVNNNEEITMIKERIQRTFPLKRFLRENREASFTVGNDCRHFTRLEFGYSSWKNDTVPVIGDPIGREHGVKNRHSVQAPVGMLRITEAELDSIRRKPSLRKLSARYKGGGNVRATPSEKKLKEFYNIMVKSHRVRYADIKRFLEE